MCLEEAAAAEGEQRGGRDATSQLPSKLSAGHEGGMEEESEQAQLRDNVTTTMRKVHGSWRERTPGESLNRAGDKMRRELEIGAKWFLFVLV
ncbi:Hypothetical predicted protein [Xyrichtys novacula]|uniref:Uncharacterized protein n=1 Tax=Xyrichtys novacula TaxID=13765 RepID=A0AAV1FXJ7_XYRNO|nr:Hypothetical predicted protein [Xyrichtys novacula]